MLSEAKLLSPPSRIWQPSRHFLPATCHMIYCSLPSFLFLFFWPLKWCNHDMRGWREPNLYTQISPIQLPLLAPVERSAADKGRRVSDKYRGQDEELSECVCVQTSREIYSNITSGTRKTSPLAHRHRKLDCLAPVIAFLPRASS